MAEIPLLDVDGAEVPYFLWDRNLSLPELRGILASPSDTRRIEMLAHVLREARPDEVWTLVAPRDVAAAWDDIAPRLGRRRAFWVWLLDGWRDRGLLE